jgi:hypothetical protein
VPPITESVPSHLHRIGDEYDSEGVVSINSDEDTSDSEDLEDQERAEDDVLRLQQIRVRVVDSSEISEEQNDELERMDEIPLPLSESDEGTQDELD